uniref:histidine kinase n=1 Tax=Desulfobacca acetoxidans TaxID=60893 RepID=A0A7C5AKD9_9BACT
MMTLPLFPLWLVESLSAILVLFLAFQVFQVTRRLMNQDPENALWLFFNWLATLLMIFACSHGVSHFVQEFLTFHGATPFLTHLRRAIGGLDSVLYVGLASIILFFHRVQRLYRRMEEDHHHLEKTSHEILALNREMEALVMERTMSEMALGIAHGIRNPLHIIGGFSHRLLKKTDKSDPTRAWLAAIAEEAKRIEQMVERFETLAQRKSSFFSQEDLNQIIRTTLELITPEIRLKKLNLVTDLTSTPLVGRLNPHLLKVAFAHLLRNAIEATRAKGTITVRTTMDGQFAVLTIKDTGKGMPPDVVERVFVPFFTTKLGGTGLGMVFVRQIVDEHRGIITLESKVGRGTTVTIRLPLRFAEAPGVSEPQPTPAAASNHGI